MLSANLRSQIHLELNEQEQKNRVWPNLIAVCLKREIFCVMVFPEIEWHAIEDIDQIDVQGKIPEISLKPETCVDKKIGTVLTFFLGSLLWKLIFQLTLVIFNT